MSGSSLKSASARRRIRQLSPTIANQIAAGEVVERPASVLKELLENSIDAGARAIAVDLEQGGIRLIRVRDDGAGIDADDLPLALARHGTSKLETIEDLNVIATLGFRGEALASISSVSRFSLRSRTASAEQGWEVAVDGTAEVGPARPAAMPVGTVIEVRDLFFNTPARRRFLKTERTEYGHVETVLKNAALSTFRVGITARHGQRRILSAKPCPDDLEGTSAGRRLQRVAEILGAAFGRDAHPVDAAGQGMRLSGWVVPAELASPNSPNQFLFLNGRAIRDPVLRHALGAAYDGLLHPGHQASYVLYLTIPPDRVDVNVHPAKREVRFHESRTVHDFVFAAVRRVLAGRDGDLDLTHVSSVIAEPAGGLPGYAAPSSGVRGPESSWAPTGLSKGAAKAAVRHSEALYAKEAPEDNPDFAARARRQAGVPATNRHTANTRPTSSPAAAFAGRACLVDRTLLVVEQAPDTWLVDIQAVLERHAAVVLANAAKATSLAGRPLLLPPIIEVAGGGEQKVRRLDDAQALLARFGLVVRAVGTTAVSLRQTPRIAHRAAPEALLRALIDLDPLDTASLVACLTRFAGSLAESDEERRTDALAAWEGLAAAAIRPRPPWATALQAGHLLPLLSVNGSDGRDDG